MSAFPKSSDRSATVPPIDAANLGIQLSEMLNKFSELSEEMATQRRMIDQLVASSGGIQHNPMSINQPEIEHQTPLLPHTQVTFVPSLTNVPEETFTYPASSFPSTYPHNIQVNSASIQMPQNCPDSQIPHHTTTEPFMLDVAQGKVEMGESFAPIDKNLLKRLDKFDEFMRKNQRLSKVGGLGYDELCLFPDMQWPLGFKMPKFSKYDGTGNPKTHLRLFANKLGKPIHDENLPIRLFPESLEGDALDWYSNLKPEEMRTWLDLSTAFVRQYEYNCELAPTRTTLESTKREPSKNHKTYAKRWRRLAAKVEPPMTEEEIVRTFIKAQDPPYFEEIFRMTGCSFAAIVNKLEEFDELVKAGKIVNVSTLKMQLEALQGQNNSGKESQFKEKEGETAFVWDQGPLTRPRFSNRLTYSSPYPYYPNSRPIYHTTINHPRPRPNYPNVPTPPFQISQPNLQTRPRSPYNPRPAAGKIGMVPPQTYSRGKPAGYDPQAICAHHSGNPGHSTRNCQALRHKIQDMIDAGDIILKKNGSQEQVMEGNGGNEPSSRRLPVIRYRKRSGGALWMWNPVRRTRPSCDCWRTYLYPDNVVLVLYDECRQLSNANGIVQEDNRELRGLLTPRLLGFMNWRRMYLRSETE
ncbi:uncharacterized protein [Coffea arabica]|uniref:Retrotransposon gag domain-containing protein n=1 Tax=Coffea arabica TaxID=13443 RepID=A0ABM4WPX7_COFAR